MVIWWKQNKKYRRPVLFFVHLFARPRPNLSFPTPPPPPDTVRPGKTWRRDRTLNVYRLPGEELVVTPVGPISNDDGHWLAETIRTTATTKTDKIEKKHLSRKTLVRVVYAFLKSSFNGASRLPFRRPMWDDSAGFIIRRSGRVCVVTVFIRPQFIGFR